MSETPKVSREMSLAGDRCKYRLVDGELEIWFPADGPSPEGWVRQKSGTSPYAKQWHNDVQAWIKEAGNLRVKLARARAIIGLFESPDVEPVRAAPPAAGAEPPLTYDEEVRASDLYYRIVDGTVTMGELRDVIRASRASASASVPGEAGLVRLCRELSENLMLRMDELGREYRREMRELLAEYDTARSALTPPPTTRNEEHE